MAYDEQGRYYFQPEIDEADSEALAQFDKMGHAAQFRKGQATRQAYNQFMDQSWQEALKAEGMSNQEYTQLFGQDPKVGSEAIKAGMRVAARSVKARRGQQPAGPSGGGEIPVEKARAMAHAKEKIQGGQQLSDDKLIDLLDELI